VAPTAVQNQTGDRRRPGRSVTLSILGTYNAVHGTAANNVWIGGAEAATITTNYPRVYRHNGSTWTQIPMAGLGTVNALWVLSSTDVWAAGQNQAQAMLRRYNGSSWTDLSPAGGLALYGVWAAGPCDVWIVGDLGAIYHYHAP
jgi:hypothetical protein